MSLSELISELVIEIKKANKEGFGGDEAVEAREDMLKRLETEINLGVPAEQAESREIKSWDDWDERVFDTVEFVRANDRIDRFKISSLTAAEVSALDQKSKAELPPEPQPREDAQGRPDRNDRHYKKDMKGYQEAQDRVNWLYNLWVLEIGFAKANGFEIPGETDEEKMKSMESKIAGDGVKIAQAILRISNLTPESVLPF